MWILGLKGLKTVQPNSSSKHPVAICVILLQFGPSVPSFVFPALLEPFLNDLSSYLLKFN